MHSLVTGKGDRNKNLYDCLRPDRGEREAGPLSPGPWQMEFQIRSYLITKKEKKRESKMLGIMFNC